MTNKAEKEKRQRTKDNEIIMIKGYPISRKEYTDYLLETANFRERIKAFNKRTKNSTKN